MSYASVHSSVNGEHLCDGWVASFAMQVREHGKYFMFYVNVSRHVAHAKPLENCLFSGDYPLNQINLFFLLKNTITWRFWKRMGYTVVYRIYCTWRIYSIHQFLLHGGLRVNEPATLEIHSLVSNFGAQQIPALILNFILPPQTIIMCRFSSLQSSTCPGVTPTWIKF